MLEHLPRHPPLPFRRCNPLPPRTEQARGENVALDLPRSSVGAEELERRPFLAGSGSIAREDHPRSNCQLLCFVEGVFPSATLRGDQCYRNYR